MGEKILNQGCIDFLQALSSKAPTPGGGGASAYVGAIGMALGSMVGSLTLGKKKYAAVQQDIEDLEEKSTALQGRFQALVEKDAEAFLPLSRAYGMPTDTEKQKAEKERVMQEALVEAANAPLLIAEACVEALALLEEYAEKGSRLAISDAGCGAAFCKAALLSARLNVLINLGLMKDESKRDEMAARLEAFTKEGCERADRIYKKVENAL